MLRGSRVPTVKLPCIVESQKTVDGKTYYKSGEISQVRSCSDCHNGAAVFSLAAATPCQRLHPLATQVLVVHPGRSGLSGARNTIITKGKGKKGRARASGSQSGGAQLSSTLPKEQQAFEMNEAPGDLQLSSGLTPPTAHIVQRRFEKTRRGKFTVRCRG